MVSEEVHNKSFSKYIEYSFKGTLNSQPLNSQPLFDFTIVRRSSRPSVVGTSVFGYYGSWGGTNDGCDNKGSNGGAIGQQQQC